MIARFIAVVALSLATTLDAKEIRVLTWNVESSRGLRQTADPATISQQLVELQHDHGPFDLVGLTEVPGASALMYVAALQTPERSYGYLLSETGGSDRMLIAYGQDRFEAVAEEPALTSHDGETFPGGNNRRPMFVTLNDRQTRLGLVTFMVNHLTRGNAQSRQRQARLLRGWVKKHPHAAIAVGDYNFDFDTVNLCGNQAMSIFLRDDASDGGRFAWRWVVPGVERKVADFRQPTERVEVIGTFRDTNWSPSRNGGDQYPTSILDFVFLGGAAREWNASSTIIVREGDFPDDERTSDHRPVMAVIGR